MAAWKMPPKAKVYEALTAYVDGRVRITGPTEAEVISSSGDKTYSVRWSEDLRQIAANDNASYWQGYTGYPIVAVLLALGRITFNAEAAKELTGVEWKRLNQKFRRDYDKAVESVLQGVEDKGGNRAAIVREAENIFTQLAALKLERGPRGAPPPKGRKEGAGNN